MSCYRVNIQSNIDELLSADRHGSQSTEHFLILALPPAVYITDRYHSFHSFYFFFPLSLEMFSWVVIPEGDCDPIACIRSYYNLPHCVSWDVLINKNGSTRARVHKHLLWSRDQQPFLPHLSPTLPFAPLIFHLSLILCLFYISIHCLFLLTLTGDWAVREQERGSCPLWVAKRLPFERSNPLHHSSYNLFCYYCGNRFLPPLHVWRLYSPFLYLSLSVYPYYIQSSSCCFKSHPQVSQLIHAYEFLFALSLSNCDRKQQDLSFCENKSFCE